MKQLHFSSNSYSRERAFSTQQSESRHLRQMFLLCGLALSAVAWMSQISSAAPKKTVKVNFGSTAKFTESCGTKGTATASGLTATQKSDIIKKMQKKYDDALGAGEVKVEEGSGGDVDIIIQGGKAPGTLAGKEYGDAGKPGKPGVVHVKEFKDDGFAGAELVNGVAESAAHEAAHKFGVSHNWEKPPKLMTKGSKVSTAERKADNRGFTADEGKKLKKAITGGKKDHKDSQASSDLGIFTGEPAGPPANKPDDHHYLDSKATFLGGPVGAEFGYISHTGEFTFQGDDTNIGGNETFMTFLYGHDMSGPESAGADMAVAIGPEVFTLANGEGFFELFSPNPNNPNVFEQAFLTFETPFGPVAFQLQVIQDFESSGTTGGFYFVPEPSTLVALALGDLLLLMCRLRPQHTFPAG